MKLSKEKPSTSVDDKRFLQGAKISPKSNRENSPVSPMTRYNDAAAKQGNFFSGKRLKKL